MHIRTLISKPLEIAFSYSSSNKSPITTAPTAEPHGIKNSEVVRQVNIIKGSTIAFIEPIIR